MAGGAAAFGLPLVDHLVKKRFACRGPSVVPQMSPRDRDLRTRAGSRRRPEFTEAPPHQGGEPELDRPQGSAKVLRIELGEERPEPFEADLVSRIGGYGWPPPRTGDGRRVGVDWKRGEDAPGGEAFGATEPGACPARDGGQHRLRGKRITRVNPKRPASSEGHQHASVPVRNDGDGGREACRAEPRFEIGHRPMIRP